jgi:hypothetical protein
MKRRKQLFIRTNPPIITLSNTPTFISAIGQSRRPDLLFLLPFCLLPFSLLKSGTMRIPPCDEPSTEIRKPIQKTHTMGIVQTFTKQHPETSLRAGGGMMYGVETYEATVGGEEEISIGTCQMRKSVKRGTVHSDKDGRGKVRLWGELNPMHIVVIGHDH